MLKTRVLLFVGCCLIQSTVVEEDCIGLSGVVSSMANEGGNYTRLTLADTV